MQLVSLVMGVQTALLASKTRCVNWSMHEAHANRTSSSALSSLPIVHHHTLHTPHSDLKYFHPSSAVIIIDRVILFNLGSENCDAGFQRRREAFVRPLYPIEPADRHAKKSLRFRSFAKVHADSARGVFTNAQKGKNSIFTFAHVKI